VPAAEASELRDVAQKQFGETAPPDAQYRAAGPFQSLIASGFVMARRTDTGSLAFETPSYGLSKTPLDPVATSRDRLLPAVDARLDAARIQAPGREFSAFHDEFVGAGPKDALPADFDPRTKSRPVARAVEYRRVMKGLPVFGSELVVGLLPDGRIGRLRLHWPAIPEQVVKDAGALAEAVNQGRWQVPEEFRRKDTEILETIAGIGHSGFADFGFRSAPVVRILVRRRGGEGEYQLISTRQVFIDSTGREVVFSAFPVVPGTPADSKVSKPPRPSAQ
jgi:hypothetical protein